MATEEQKSTDEEREDAQASGAGDDRDDLEGRSSDASGSSDSDEDTSSDDGSSSVDEPAADTRDEDDDEGDAGEGAAAAGAAGAAAGSRSAERSAAERASAGARLAAAKAAKAAKKAARKARDQAESGTLPAGMTGGASKPADEVLAESVVGQAASKASDWAQNNRPIALGVAALALVGLLGWAGWTWYTSSQAHAAGTLLAAAIEIANGEIRAEGETDAEASEDGEDAEPTYATQEERARAALEAYQRVVTEHGGTEAARWARLGVAWAHFELGEMEPAREAYEQTLREAGGDPVIAWRALEGMGFTYEATQQWDEAIAKYDELGHVEDGAYSAPADYHTARMHIAKGETVEATTQLRALIERLRADSESGEPDFPFVLAQAEIRLRELDPTAAGASSPSLIGPGGGGGGGDGLPAGLEGLPPEILEQLRRQIQEQGATGAPGGAGEAGGGGGE